MQLTHPVVMAIVNVTPDSFFADSRAQTLAAALAAARRALACGATILDIGGESTRPGAEAVEPAVEIDRVLPVIRELRALAPEAFLSIDTRHAEVAAAALEAGADILNHVEGTQAPEVMAPLVCGSGAGYVLMHSRGTPGTMDALAGYTDAVSEVLADLTRAAAAAESLGVAREQICLDPGLGFAKRPEDSWALLRATDRLAALPYPCLIGASRKRFLGGASPEERLAASLEAAAEAARLGAQILRVHDAAETVERLSGITGISG